MTIDVLDYLGKHEDGIIVSITIGFDGEYYDAHFYYKQLENSELFVAVSCELFEEKINCQIEDWEKYDELIVEIGKKVIPFKEMISRIDEFDPATYNLYREDSKKEDNNQTQ
jgi:hypothetical protein